MKRILTVGEAAQFFGVSRQTIRHRVKRGELKRATGVYIMDWAVPKNTTLGSISGKRIMSAVNRVADRLEARG